MECMKDGHEKDLKFEILVDSYWSTLFKFAKQYEPNEGGTSVAFQTLLAEAACAHQLTFIPQVINETASKQICLSSLLMTSSHRSAAIGKLKEPLALPRDCA